MVEMKPPNLVRRTGHISMVEGIANIVERNHSLDEIKENLVHAQNRMKLFPKRTPFIFTDMKNFLIYTSRTR